MPICPECLSQDMVKFGKYGSQQRWRCMRCGLTTIYPHTRTPIQRKGRKRELQVTKMTVYKDCKTICPVCKRRMNLVGD